MSKSNKLTRAVEIVKSSQTKENAINEIMTALQVTKPNAFVYYTKAKKAIGMPVGTRSPKATTEAQVSQASA